MKKRHITILSLGHMATDINQGALPAMLPFFIAAYDLSYTAAASIVFAVNMSSSVIQPLFGLAADRYTKPWLLPGGLMFAGLGLGLTGLFDGYQWIMILGIMSGIGIAAYHPEAARLVNFAAGDRKSTAMSLFGVGGTIGFTIGPLIVSTAMLQWGLAGSLVLVVPVTIMSAIIISHFPLFEALEKINNSQELQQAMARMYQEQAGAAGAAPEGGPQPGPEATQDTSSSSTPADDNVVDAEVEDVDDKN